MLQAAGISKRFATRGRTVTALADVDLQVAAGQIVCVAGRSGAGKSTLLKCLLGLERPDRGEVLLDGAALTHMNAAELLSFRRAVAPIMQDPAASLPPRMRVGMAIAEPLRIQKDRRGDLSQEVGAVLAKVQLEPQVAGRFTHELSGGQQQRVAIARAIIGQPRFVLADEPTSALDVVTAMHIAQLLRGLVDELGLGLLVISHDPLLAWHLGAQVVHFAEGRIIESLPAQAWLDRSRSEWRSATGPGVP
jgi:ABC-type glutathione transport system ATPase component